QWQGNGAARALPGDGGGDGGIYRHEVWGASLDELRDFLKHSPGDFGCRAVARPKDGGFSTEVYASEPMIRSLQSARAVASVRVTRRQNASAEGRARQSEASRANRFAVRAAV